jgi:hypothetical protein
MQGQFVEHKDTKKMDMPEQLTSHESLPMIHLTFCLVNSLNHLPKSLDQSYLPSGLSNGRAEY